MATERSRWVVRCVRDPAAVVMFQSTQGLEDRKPGVHVENLSTYQEHLAYQRQTSDPTSEEFIKKISAGTTFNEDGGDGQVMEGSHFILEGSREQVEAFIRNDPFHKAGIWKSFSVLKYEELFQ
eukprot:gnl/MRDRNA2_/MRDRNA2_34322_c0_seq1.p1 gnl/MRDRNA2_/MRDRNA2_34322_c0~~gnl/MRDRNA2_/MRDRNA2_34322_c0_seq1.p1  ORF type:complete len:144 (-),score=23.84 gnl/MRDRNA2_/MRDRNA2_34322_c0_seq1:37-408(-)